MILQWNELWLAASLPCDAAFGPFFSPARTHWNGHSNSHKWCFSNNYFLHIPPEKVQFEAHAESCRGKQLHHDKPVTLRTFNKRHFAKRMVAQLETISGIIDVCGGMRVGFFFLLSFGLPRTTSAISISLLVHVVMAFFCFLPGGWKPIIGTERCPGKRHSITSTPPDVVHAQRNTSLRRWCSVQLLWEKKRSILTFFFEYAVANVSRLRRAPDAAMSGHMTIRGCHVPWLHWLRNTLSRACFALRCVGEVKKQKQKWIKNWDAPLADDKPKL